MKTIFRTIICNLEQQSHSFFFSIHNGLQLFEVSQFDLQLFHLCFNQQSHQRLNLPLFNRSQVLDGQKNEKKDWRANCKISLVIT